MKKVAALIALAIAIPQAAIAQVQAAQITTNNGKKAFIFWGLGEAGTTVNLTVSGLIDAARIVAPNTCGFAVFKPKSGESIISYKGHSGFSVYSPSTYAKPSAASVPTCTVSTPAITAPFIAVNGSLVFPSTSATNAEMITQITRNIKIGKCGMIRYIYPAGEFSDSTMFSVGNFIESAGDISGQLPPICYKGILYKPL
jgi:hypothetical protein